MSQKPPSKREKGRPHSLSDSDIVSKTSVRRMPAPRHTGADSDAGKAAKATDRDAASERDKRAPPEQRAGNDKDRD